MFNEDDEDDYFVDLMTPPTKEIVKIEEVIEETTLEEDFQRAKRNLEDIARDITAAAADAAAMARQMAEPRGYDALSKVASAAVAANKAVVELYKNKVEGKHGESGKEPQTVNHNTIIMTTAQMAERLKQIAAETSSPDDIQADLQPASEDE